MGIKSMAFFGALATSLMLGAARAAAPGDEQKQVAEPANEKRSATQPVNNIPNAKPSIQDYGLDPKLIKEWRAAGALVGWLVQADYGTWHYLIERPDGVEALPVFLMQRFDPKVLAALPAPKVPFAASFGQTKFNDDGLTELARFKHLRSVDLSHTKVTDKGLKRLSAVENLNSVDLGASAVTDKGLKQLSKIQQLRKIYIGSTATTDKGIKRLTNLQKLDTLYLYNTSITDAGLLSLAEAEHLRIVILTNTRVSPKGIEEFSSRAPNVGIGR